MTTNFKITKHVTDYKTLDIGVFTETDSINAIYSAKEENANARKGNFEVKDLSTGEARNYIISCDRCYEVVTDGVNRRHIEV